MEIERSVNLFQTFSGAVALIPLTDDGKLVLVKQYRKSLNRTFDQIPAERD